MWMETCFHSHFYANFHASVTLLFLFRFSWNFHQNVKLRNWEWYTPFWEVYAHFWIGKGPIFGPKSGLEKSLQFRWKNPSVYNGCLKDNTHLAKYTGCSGSLMPSHTSHIMRRPVLQVYNRVRFNQAHSATGTSLILESLDMTIFAFIQNCQQTKKGADQTGCRLIHVLAVKYTGLQIRVHNWKLLFLFLNQNIGYRYSKEPSQWHLSFGNSKRMFKLMSKELVTILGSKNDLWIWHSQVSSWYSSLCNNNITITWQHEKMGLNPYSIITPFDTFEISCIWK